MSSITLARPLSFIQDTPALEAATSASRPSSSIVPYLPQQSDLNKISQLITDFVVEPAAQDERTERVTSKVLNIFQAVVQQRATPKGAGLSGESAQLSVLPILLKKLNAHFATYKIDIFRDLGSLSVQDIIKISLIDLYLNIHKHVDVKADFVTLHDAIYWILNCPSTTELYDSFQEEMCKLKVPSAISTKLLDHLKNAILPLMKFPIFYNQKINSSSSVRGCQFICSLNVELIKTLQPNWDLGQVNVKEDGRSYVLRLGMLKKARLLLTLLELKDDHQQSKLVFSYISWLSYVLGASIDLRTYLKKASTGQSRDLLDLNHALKFAKQFELTIGCMEKQYEEEHAKENEEEEERLTTVTEELDKIYKGISTFCETGTILVSLIPILESALRGVTPPEINLDCTDLELPEKAEKETEQVKAKASQKPKIPKKRKAKDKSKKVDKIESQKSASAELDPHKHKLFLSPVHVIKKEITSTPQLLHAFSAHISDAYSISDRVAPLDAQRVSYTRSQLAQHHQLYANACIGSILDLQKAGKLTKEQLETLHSFTLLWSYIAAEQALTASYVQRFPDELLVHRLSFLLHWLKLPKESSWTRSAFLDRLSIGFRYGHAAGLKDEVAKEAVEKESSSSLTESIQGALKLQTVALQATPPSSNSEELSRLLQHFAKIKDEPIKPEAAPRARALSDQKLQSQEKQLSETILQLEQKIKAIAERREVSRQQVKVLRDALTHFKNLRNLLSLVISFGGDASFGSVLMHMVVLSAQFFVENTGLYLFYREGNKTEELWQVHLDLHDLEFYSNHYNLAQPLKAPQKELLNLLNIGNKGTYPHAYFAKTTKEDTSKLMLFINELYKRSKVAEEAGSDFTPGTMRETYLPKLVDYCDELSSLCNVLATHHLLS